jgi:hypothetical protein
LVLEPKTQNPKPKTQNPKPKTQNPKPEIRNPNPSDPQVYLTADHERAMFGMYSPAPNTYGATSSLGQQWLSRNANAQNFKFGSADRFSEVRNKDGFSGQPTPGPGAYSV